ncbi:MAG TPA: phosphopantothenoylcysteine decarboxylase [Pontiella sp.]|nr:phosphopantothenoylcysteine decarboxylase [Pontiella sp.]
MTKKLLILSGPTHEYFDPVRFVGNASSGLMGKALAEEAAERGYFVDVVSGPVPALNLPRLGAAGRIHNVVAAADMLECAARLFPAADAVIFAAAVADYAPVERSAEKMPKLNDELVLHLRPTPDIAKTLGEVKKTGQITIGFALQTSDGERHAARKLREKKLDGIVLNTPASLGADTGSFRFLTAGAQIFDDWGCIEKSECAKRILDSVERLSHCQCSTEEKP